MPDPLDTLLSKLYDGAVDWVFLPPEGDPTSGLGEGTAPVETPVFSGSFRPLHQAHRRIHRKVSELRGGCSFEIATANFTKGRHPPDRIRRVLQQFRGFAPVLVTAEATFAGKARLLPGRPEFVVGADVFEKVVTHPVKPDARFLVFNRALPDEPERPEWMPLRKRFAGRADDIEWEEIPFERMDISSTELRREAGGGPPIS